MTYKSKDINLDVDPKNWGPEWTKNDLVWVVEKLESMSRGQLINLCEHKDIQLRFSAEDWRESTPIDQIIAVLLIDHSPKTLIAIINSLQGE